MYVSATALHLYLYTAGWLLAVVIEILEEMALASSLLAIASLPAMTVDTNAVSC